MSRWGSTQTSAQWNTTTMTRVRVSESQNSVLPLPLFKSQRFCPISYGKTMKLPIILIFECAGSQYTVDQEKDEETDGRKRCLSTYIYILFKTLQRRIQKLTSLLPIQKCLPVSFCFFLLLPILAPVSCIC